MMVQTAVIQIDGAHHAADVVADKDLAVNKARRVLVNLHARFQQGAVVGFRQGVRDLLVGDAGEDQLHVHAALGSEAESRLQLAVQNQIRRHDVHILSRAGEDVHIDPLAHPILIQRTVGIRQDKALFVLKTGGMCQQPAADLRGSFIHAPELQEHQREAARRLAADHESRILPVAVFRELVDVLVRQIDAAGEGHLTVNDSDLAVVAVVVVGGNHGRRRRKDAALDAQLVQAFGVVAGQGGELAGAVVHETDLHALAGLFREDLQHLAPHTSLVHDEIFQKNEAFGLLQLLFQSLEFGFTA